MFDGLGGDVDGVIEFLSEGPRKQLGIVHALRDGQLAFVDINKDDFLDGSGALHGLQLRDGTPKDADYKWHRGATEGKEGLRKDGDEDVLPYERV